MEDDAAGVDERRCHVPVQQGAQRFYVEAIVLDDEEEVSARPFAFEEFVGAIGAVTDGVTGAIAAGVRKARPSKVALEFGCEVGVESGKLTAVLVKGTAKANLKVVLEWSPGQE